jgi:hypothetical protein
VTDARQRAAAAPADPARGARAGAHAPVDRDGVADLDRARKRRLRLDGLVVLPAALEGGEQRVGVGGLLSFSCDSVTV